MEQGQRSGDGETIAEGRVLPDNYLSKRFHPRDLEEESDESFLKRLRTIEQRVLNYSKVVLKLGPTAEEYELHMARVVGLANQSEKLRGIMESTFEKAGNGSDDDGNYGRCSAVPIIDLEDFPCDADIFRIVEDFCFCNGVMEESIICISNVVRLFNAGRFLQIKSLLSAVQKFIENNVFDSWKNCLQVLATFDCNDLPRADTLLENTEAWMDADIGGASTLFEVFEKVFLKKIEITGKRSVKDVTVRECSAECLVQVARLLHPNLAKRIYLSCEAMGFGISLKGRSSWIEFFSHQRKTQNAASYRTWWFKIETGNDAPSWIENLPWNFLAAFSRRSLLVTHLSKMMRLKHFTRGIDSSIEMGFLCAILVEAAELNKATEKSENAKSLHEEIVFLEMFVAKGLLQILYTMELFAEGRDDNAFKFARQNKIILLLTKFNFGTLLSIMKHFVSSDHDVIKRNIVGAGNLLDRCMREHIKARSLTTKEVLMIYKQFPNNLRPSHVDFYQALRTASWSEKEMHEMSTLLDYEKLPFEIVEKLFSELQLGCDPRIVKRVLEIQALKSDQELIQLRRDLNLRAAELERGRTKLRGEISLRIAELVQLRMDKELEEKKLKDESKRASEVHKANAEQLVRLQNELDAMLDAKKSLEKEKIELIKSKQSVEVERDTATLEKNLAEIERNALEEAKTQVESERDAAKRAHGEEKQKTTCQICLENPRDTLCLPCMHFHYCSDCLLLHHQRKKSCPTCRAFTSGVMKCNLTL